MKRTVLGVIIVCVYLLLTFNALATQRLNKKYIDTVTWDSELKQYCESSEDEEITAEKCKYLGFVSRAGIKISGVFYDEDHPEVEVKLTVQENKFYQVEYQVSIIDRSTTNNGYADSEFAGTIYVDKNLRPISKGDVEIDKDTVSRMNDMQETMERIVDIANNKWNLGMQLE